MPQDLAELAAPLLAVLTFLIDLVATAYVVLRKRDARAAIGWLGVIWLVPWVGALLYLLLGVNRIRRAAVTLRGERHRELASGEACRAERETLLAQLGEEAAHLGALSRLVDRAAGVTLVGGNRVGPLVNGDEAYPAMLEAIERAEHSVGLLTYIFDDGPSGRRFVEALAAARDRGVEVRVLIDALGARYSRPPVPRLLARRGVIAARFLPALLPRAFPYFNLRNHRKILVVDGKVAFTGGMNIREQCVLEGPSRRDDLTRDVHFVLKGPVVAHLAEVFAEDWVFATGERLEGTKWFPGNEPAGDTVARGIPDGPDEDFERVLWTLLGAISSARRSIRIVTPYFLPTSALVSALNVAAMRGVSVDIVVPERSNLRFVDWAMWGQIWQVLDHGCRVWLSPAPFDHSKLMTVDGAWTLLGSANWDPRTLRLNFELCVECYDRELARWADGFVAERVAAARRLTADEVRRRPLAMQLRDGIARLFAPYL